MFYLHWLDMASSRLPKNPHQQTTELYRRQMEDDDLDIQPDKNLNGNSTVHRRSTFLQSINGVLEKPWKQRPNNTTLMGKKTDGRWDGDEVVCLYSTNCGMESSPPKSDQGAGIMLKINNGGLFFTNSQRRRPMFQDKPKKPELTDDDDEADLRPIFLRKRMKAKEETSKEPVPSTSGLIFPNPWRREEPKLEAKQSTSNSNDSSRTGINGDDVICLNGGIGTTLPSLRKPFSGFTTGLTASLGGLDKSLKFISDRSQKKKTSTSLFSKINPYKSLFTRNLLNTKADTIRLEERNQYVKVLDSLRRGGSSRFSSLSSNFSKNSSPADSGRSSQTGITKQALTKSKVPLSEYIKNHVNWFNSSHSSFVDAIGENTRRVLNYDEANLPVQIEKETPKKEVELIDITQEESSNSSDSVICETPVSQTKLVTSPRLLSASSKKIEDLGAHIREVLNRSLGPAESDNVVIELSDDEKASSSDSSSKENDEIQLITPVRSKEPLNAVSLDISSSPYASSEWLNKHKNSYSESRREKYDKIRREEKLLEVLRSNSKYEKDLNEQIRRTLSLTDVIILETPEEEGKLPELTDDILDVIDHARAPGRSLNDVITRTPNNIEITRSDIRSLEPTQWLNDNVINSYLDMIAARNKSRPNNWPSVYVFTTFFYPKYLNEGYSNILKRWTRKVDLFSFDLLIFPIHLGIHWCLAAADIRNKTIKYYDSLGGKNFQCPKALLQYLKQEHQERKKSQLNDMDWKLEIVEDIPQQQNGSDCGMFACKFAEYLSRDARLTFKQEDMNYYRERMIYEIVAQDLLYP